MGRFHTSEALVLKAYDIGDADRFCVLLTEAQGRVPVIAKGARKLGSRWGSALQSFQHVRVDLADHSSGTYLQSAQCLSPFPRIRSDLEAFMLASGGSELLLHFLHDTEPGPSIFALARDYFQCCDERTEMPGGVSLLFPTFQLMLLRELGFLPSSETLFKNHPTIRPSDRLQSFFRTDGSIAERIRMLLSERDQRALRTLCDELLKDHLSFPLRSVAVSALR